MKNCLSIVLVAVAALLAGCGDDTSTPAEVTVPSTYAFESRFEAGASSVSYSGQVARQVLIHDLKGYIGGLDESIDGGSFMPGEGDVVAALDFYFRFDSDANGAEAIGVSGTLPFVQSSYSDISSGKNLVDKFAGNDTATDHKDWSAAFVGWSDPAIAANGGGLSSPEALLTAFFETIEANAIGRANGTVRSGPDGVQLPVYVTDSGLDLQQLSAKLLLMAVDFSQGTDDYLDDDVDGKGLLADNSAPDEEGAAFSALEHAWDEGFGYFGAPRDYGDYGLELLADTGYRDSDGDGSIDLTREFAFGASVNAAKRDLGANVSPDFVGNAWEGFRRGRAIIAAAGGPLSETQLTDLRAARDQAVSAWEGAIAATVVHYINDTIQAMDTMGTPEYDFAAHAKVWSEMKGFALGFQFNPRSPLSDADFAQLHGLLGDAPVLEASGGDALSTYRADLLSARDLLQQAYGFDPSNMGDADGNGGW